MSDLLIMQSHGAPPDAYAPYLALSRPIHEEYARRCGADYQLVVGTVDRHAHPAWNRIHLFLRAFDEGYRKVVWLDADTLVVKPDRSIFEHTPNDVPLLMCRTSGFPWPPDTDDAWEGYNDGVLVANRLGPAIQAFEYVWSQRRAPSKMPSLWELAPLLDWVKAHPLEVGELDARWNWMAFEQNLAFEDDAAIKAWHGYPHRARWECFLTEYEKLTCASD